MKLSESKRNGDHPFQCGRCSCGHLWDVHAGRYNGGECLYHRCKCVGLVARQRKVDEVKNIENSSVEPLIT